MKGGIKGLQLHYNDLSKRGGMKITILYNYIMLDASAAESDSTDEEPVIGFVKGIFYYIQSTFVLKILIIGACVLTRIALS